MASIPPSYYHASAAILIANHGDFFNTHGIFRQLTSNSSCESFALIDLFYLPAQKLPIATPGSFN